MKRVFSLRRGVDGLILLELYDLIEQQFFIVTGGHFIYGK